ncbi:MAG: hypothetical protein ABIW47_01845 [Ginsengibacter sp.]
MRQICINYCVLVFFTLGLQTKADAQTDSLLNVLPSINYPISSFAVGNLGELYIISTDNQLKKLDETGDSVGVFNQVTKYGKLSYVVAQNPWKTLLFYKNFSIIVILDKYLNITGSINLRNKNILRSEAITNSYDNNIWVYDEQENKLKKIDDSGNVLSETTDFRNLFDVVPTPKRIIDYDGFVYLYDPEFGLYIFDYYGSFKKKLPFPGWSDFAVIGKSIYGFDAEKIYKYTSPLPQADEYPLPVNLRNNTSIKVSNHKLYILKDQKLGIYSLP